MKVAITGATGFVGQSLEKIIKNKNLKLIRTYNNTKPLSKKNKHLKLDITKKNVDYYKYLQNPDILIHLAWSNLDDFNHKNHLSKTLKAHKYFLSNLIKQGLSNLVVAGTCFEYGKKTGSLKEDCKPKPILKYAIAKNNLRKFLFNLQKKYKFNLTWLRFFYIYGYNKSRKTLTNILIDSSRKKKKIIVNSLIKRDFLSVKNIAKYISLLALKRENLGIVNLCSGKSISLKSLINILTKEYKIKPIVKYEHIKLRNYESNNFYGNNSKLTEILNS